MIKLDNIYKKYDNGDCSTVALDHVNLTIDSPGLLFILGPSGSGKTTLLNLILGITDIENGNLILDGKDITKVPAHKIVSMGIAHVPEGRRVFAQLTVLQNLKMGAYTRNNKQESEETIKKIYKRFPRLEERKNQLAGTLSGGEQQMLAMGRAIMSAPKLIVMDEPSMGLSPVLVQEVFSIIGTMHELGITILLVEQNAKMALAIADRAYVLENGRITMSGSAHDLLHDDKVRKAYLGA